MTLMRGQASSTLQLAPYLGGLQRHAGLTCRALGIRAQFHHVVMWRAVGDPRRAPSWMVVLAFATVCEDEIEVLGLDRRVVPLGEDAAIGILDHATLKVLWRADGRGQGRRRRR